MEKNIQIYVYVYIYTYMCVYVYIHITELICYTPDANTL